MHELQQGLETAKQLHISPHVPCSSQESYEVLVQKIIGSFERALKMVNLKIGQVGHPSSQALSSMAAMRMSSQSPTFGASPHSENLDQDLREINHSSPKRRKTIPSWTKLIRVNPGMEVEGPLDDGYNWIKYGQKNTHGAKYPRCAQRNVQGCMATKQVQRSDQDLTIFEVNYWESHTCTMASNVTPSAPQENKEPNLSTIPQKQPSDNLHMNLHAAGLIVQTKNLDQSSSSSFHYVPSISTIKSPGQLVPVPTMIENNLAEKLDPHSYVSPATSYTTYSPVPPSLAQSGSEINHMISAVTSAANSPTIASLDFPFDQYNILDRKNFTFDDPPFS
ncbi:hypothetical protein VNO78_30737 [Psophocarpus tetragonolobus]|uniref:WRKY domain-containing protein n=1 Tax=Psophocarpus tetragonolobus TaxID=3891 RepID=A0AAN9RX57_PSOTE